MKWRLLFLLPAIVAFSVNAQKSSKWGVEIRPFFYTDFYGIEAYNWPHLFADGYAPLVDKNSLSFGKEPKVGSINIPINGTGIRVDVVRHLFPIAGSDRNRVDWSLGVGYKGYKTKEIFSPDIPNIMDTAIVYQYNDLRLRYTQRYADLQTKAIYKIMGANSKCGVYFGFALQMSLALGGRIQEEFRVRENSWNSASRNWSINDKAPGYQNVPTKKINYFSWGIPFGLFFKLSDHVSLLPEFTYWHNTNRKYYYPDNFEGEKKTFSKGSSTTIALRYDF
jgi:hypothetical protein